jgi:hypothetical protein
MKVWITSSFRDRRLVHQIVEALDEAGVEVSLAENTIQPGQSITEGVVSGISEADAVLVVISSASTDSPGVLSEIALAVANEQRDPQRRVIPVLAERRADIPPFLSDKLYVDLSARDRFQSGIALLVKALKNRDGAPPVTGAERPPSPEVKLQFMNAQLRALELELAEFAWRRRAATFLIAGVMTVLIALVGIAAGLVTLFELGSEENVLARLIPFFIGLGASLLSGLSLYLVHAARKALDAARKTRGPQ